MEREEGGGEREGHGKRRGRWREGEAWKGKSRWREGEAWKEKSEGDRKVRLSNGEWEKDFCKWKLSTFSQN